MTFVCDEETKKERQKERNHTMANWLFAETAYIIRSVCSLACWVIFSLQAMVISFKFHQNQWNDFRDVCTHNRFTALLEFVRDYPGEQVPER